MVSVGAGAVLDDEEALGEAVRAGAGRDRAGTLCWERASAIVGIEVMRRIGFMRSRGRRGCGHGNSVRAGAEDVDDSVSVVLPSMEELAPWVDAPHFVGFRGGIVHDHVAIAGESDDDDEVPLRRRDRRAGELTRAPGVGQDDRAPRFDLPLDLGKRVEVGDEGLAYELAGARGVDRPIPIEFGGGS